MRLYPLSIPLRRSFEHAAHVRSHADPIVVQVELADGTLGHGETLPRSYVTGETSQSVESALESTLLEPLLSLHPGCFPDALEVIDALPLRDADGHLIAAARAGIELALLDAYGRHFGRSIGDVAGWMGLAGFGSPGSVRSVRYSGVLSGGDPDRLTSSLRKMRWFGLRDFKLKVGYDDDVERVKTVVETLGGSLNRSTTLRLDANGAWTLEQASERLAALEDLPIRFVEQPLACNRDGDLVVLRAAVPVDIMHDESLLTMDDARRLLDLGVADAFNIRVSKNGGFMPALRLADMARRHGILYQLGCMVGETSILSAVGRRFLETAPGATFAEGSYGRFLLLGDVVQRAVQLGCGGKIAPLAGPGWGVEVQPERLQHHLAGSVIEYPF